MRKELIVYVNTNERGETISVASLAVDRKYVIFNMGGNKAIIDVEDLESALAAIKEFNDQNNSKDEIKEAQVSKYMDIEYGNEE